MHDVFPNVPVFTKTPRPFHRIAPAVLACALLPLLSALSPSIGAAEDWPHWRGPRLDGTSVATGLPSTWSQTENVRWRLELPGPGNSTPVAADGRLFLTSAAREGDELFVMAVDTSGKELWRRKVSQGKLEVFAQFQHETSPASPSPSTDGERVWALFTTGTLVAFDRDGKQLWVTDVAERYGAPKMYFGMSASPLHVDGKLYLQMLHTDRQLVLALDAATGKEVWTHERKTDARAECLHSYASPTYYPGASGDGLVLIHGADYLTAHRTSDGAEVWRHGGLNPAENYNTSFRLVATPTVSADGLIVLPTAKRGPVYGLRPAGAATGTLTGKSEHVAWHLERGTPDVPSPLVDDGLVYLSGERGTLTVLDGASGEQLYSERVHQSPHRGSPVLADGKLFLTGTDGTVSVVRAGRRYELLAQNTLDERLTASPVIYDGVLYLRTHEALYAVASTPVKEKGGGAGAGPETTSP